MQELNTHVSFCSFHRDTCRHVAKVFLLMSLGVQEFHTYLSFGSFHREICRCIAKVFLI